MGHDIQRLERLIEGSLQPGRFISYNQSGDFVQRVEAAAGEVGALIKAGEAAQAASLFEAFIGAAYLKSEEIDDSSGDFGMFVDQLFCDWVRARQAAKASSAETAKQLLHWMENDDYGYCHELERDLIKVLSKPGLQAFADEIRARLEPPPPDGRGAQGHARSYWEKALKRILAAQGDAEAYLSLAEATTLTAEDCHGIAVIFEGRGDLAEALRWVDRGLELTAAERYSSAKYDLKRLQRALLPKVGRADEAISAAWADFKRAPSTHTYETLMELVPAEEKAAWHEKALQAAEQGEPSSVLGLLVETGETDRLAARVAALADTQLQAMSHYTTEPVAEKLADPHPALAARVYRAMGLRIVDAGKSKYYDAALGNFERARDCYLAAGQAAEWEALVQAVSYAHGRKSSFMDGFERIAEGGPAVEARPSFLERARGRWPGGGA